MIKKGKLLLFLALLMFLFLLFLRVNHQPRKTLYTCLDCNVILITMDAVRADHLGIYDYPKNTSPNIDNLAKEGIVFTQAYTQASWTLPSFASLFTSLYPSVHKVGYTDDTTKLNQHLKTLAEILKEKNYTTAAFITVPYISSYYNFNKGFDIYDESMVFSFKPSEKPNCENITTKAIKWLEENKHTKFFLFLHYFGGHSPYNPPERYVKMFGFEYKGNLSLDKTDQELNEMNLTAEDVNYAITGYDGSIRYR